MSDVNIDKNTGKPRRQRWTWARRHDPLRHLDSIETGRAYDKANARVEEQKQLAAEHVGHTFEPTADTPGFVSYAASMPTGTSSEHAPSPFSEEGFGSASPATGGNRPSTAGDGTAEALKRAFLSPASPKRPRKERGASGISPQSRRRLSHYKKAKTPFVPLILGTLAIMAAIVASLAFGSVLYMKSALSELPSVDSESMSEYSETGITSIYANDASTLLAQVFTVNRIEVPFDDISDYVKEATVAIEDARFYEHHGVDPVGVARAAMSTLGGSQQGGSTITQQLVRNTVLLDEMNDISIKRKLREMALAFEMEEQYGKDELLNMYLNVVNYGDGCYGIEAAARDYFGTSASELTLSQASLLAGVPQSPNYYNPRENYEGAMARRKLVLYRMYDEHMISQEQYEEALADEPEIAEEGGLGESVSDIAPYFVDYIKQMLEEGDEADQPLPSSVPGKGGLTIVTTLDPGCQEAANSAVESIMGSYDELDAALASVDPDTGAVVAMVGGKDYSSNQYNLATQMSRQAGSSFKPFALVAALTAGVSPNSIYLPAGGTIHIGDWTVSNSDGEGSGQMNLTQATVHSLNTIYAMVTHGIGPDKVAVAAKEMGIRSPLNAVDSICLGTQGINPLEMASAYGTLATGGIHHEYYAISSITDSRGNTVYEHEDDEGQRVVSEAVAKDATSILQQVITSGTGTGARLYSGQAAAGKTGTSENGRDMWFVGYTPQLSTAVWTGRRDDVPTYLYGSTTSTPIWKLYMDAALSGQSNESFPGASSSAYYYTDWDFTSYVSR